MQTHTAIYAHKIEPFTNSDIRWGSLQQSQNMKKKFQKNVKIENMRKEKVGEQTFFFFISFIR